MRYCYVSVYRLPGHKKGVKRDRGSLSGDKGAGAGLRTVILDSAEGVWCVVCACVCVCVCVCVGVWCVCVCVCAVYFYLFVYAVVNIIYHLDFIISVLFFFCWTFFHTCQNYLLSFQPICYL